MPRPLSRRCPFPSAPHAATASGTSTVATTSAATAEDVDYATWQQDCRAVMDQALRHLKQRIAAARPGEKQAIVFDIDNTALETDFGFSYPQPANKPVLNVAKYAQGPGVSVFFVTAHPGIIHLPTEYNLKYVGYDVSAFYHRRLLTSSRTSPPTRPPSASTSSPRATRSSRTSGTAGTAPATCTAATPRRRTSCRTTTGSCHGERGAAVAGGRQAKGAGARKHRPLSAVLRP